MKFPTKNEFMIFQNGKHDLNPLKILYAQSLLEMMDLLSVEIQEKS